MEFTGVELTLLIKSCELARDHMLEVLHDNHYGLAEVPKDVVYSAQWCLCHIEPLIKKLKEM